MKLQKVFRLWLWALLLLPAVACVTQKQYDELLDQKEGQEQELADLEEELIVTRQQAERLERRINAMTQDSAAQGQELRAATDSLERISGKYEQLSTYYNNLLTNSGKMTRDLAEQRERLMRMEEDLVVSQQRNRELRRNLDQRETSVRSLEKEVAAREQKVAELEKVLAEKDSAVAQLKERVTNALLNFGSQDLTVEVRNGKVYVSLAEALLFKSGSSTVDAKGKKALEQLAGALKENQGVNVMVEGHTDNVPISRTSQYMKDNWDLSVMRATSIVRILTKAGVAPERVIASGRGEHVPVTTNDTAENKAQNRRTEIILTPQLDELLEILGN